MFPVERALLIINRTAGTGQSESINEQLAALFRQGLEEHARVQVELVSNHSDARACVAAFLAASEAPALVVAGGGGGTLRAVVEGVCNSAELPGPERVRVGALRMGSGNLLAKQFGVPRDPVRALEGLLVNLKAGRTAPCCVMRCRTWTTSGSSELHHAVSLGGLGQFGHIPSDLARWHARIPNIRKAAARLFRLEQITNLEYGLAVLLRSISSMLSANGAETIAIQFQNRQERLRLLSGVVMNFPIAPLPFSPAVTVEDPSLIVYLIPQRGRWSPLLQVVAPRRLVHQARSIRIEPDQPLEIRFENQDPVELFLDEDPVTTYKKLTLEVAGSLAFVPGPDYVSPGRRGVSK